MDEENTVKVVTLPTAHIRDIFARFLDVIVIDATFNTNKQHYKLFSVMVHDAYGHGQHVQVRTRSEVRDDAHCGHTDDGLTLLV